MKKIYKLMATTRTWKDAVDGKVRKHRIEAGAIFQSPTGRLCVRVEALPCTAAFDGWLAAVPVAENEDQEPL
jgi:hypothetical protein